MKYKNSKIFEWTDGGNAANIGYFDGSGGLLVFSCVVFGKVMDDVEYGTKCKITFKIETEEKAVQGENKWIY